ncbi:hypothetical protein CYLTODRAFT_494241 [Cylindrobasidium torrendii FP15055 ss-10]|uniref:Uncharacterized protein n=1 Tax=Cylindrobasidium torrendii FP15055 ss-10 TaxID=1314674 RepID=A0A0D7B0G6_9AGAR|nr:hypothetical protein CYLTODRAFT_494241 [Cylindrobasidium torrendii FP15055 ss-10]
MSSLRHLLTAPDASSCLTFSSMASAQSFASSTHSTFIPTRVLARIISYASEDVSGKSLQALSIAGRPLLAHTRHRLFRRLSLRCDTMKKLIDVAPSASITLGDPLLFTQTLEYRGNCSCGQCIMRIGTWCLPRMKKLKSLLVDTSFLHTADSVLGAFLDGIGHSTITCLTLRDCVFRALSQYGRVLALVPRLGLEVLRLQRNMVEDVQVKDKLYDMETFDVGNKRAKATFCGVVHVPRRSTFKVSASYLSLSLEHTSDFLLLDFLLCDTVVLPNVGVLVVEYRDAQDMHAKTVSKIQDLVSKCGPTLQKVKLVGATPGNVEEDEPVHPRPPRAPLRKAVTRVFSSKSRLRHRRAPSLLVSRFCDIRILDVSQIPELHVIIKVFDEHDAASRRVVAVRPDPTHIAWVTDILYYLAHTARSNCRLQKLILHVELKDRMCPTAFYAIRSGRECSCAPPEDVPIHKRWDVLGDAIHVAGSTLRALGGGLEVEMTVGPAHFGEAMEVYVKRCLRVRNH